MNGDGDDSLSASGVVPTSAERVYIIVPPLIANAISRHPETDFVLTLAGLIEYNVNKGNPQNYSGMLEYIGRQCMQNRLTTKLADLKKTPKFHDLLPFLENSIFPNIPAKLNGTTCCFPKFVHTK